MRTNFFVTDLHGKVDRYEKLFTQIIEKEPETVFIGGDNLPKASITYNGKIISRFITDYLAPRLHKIRRKLQDNYPEIFIIFGNDDPKMNLEDLLVLDDDLIHYIHEKKFSYKDYTILGYANVPPTPFLLKDWEKFDVSHYVDVGSVSPLEGFRTVPPKPHEVEYYTIQKDLQRLTEGIDFSKTIFLFHSPPYKTNLDRAALDGKKFNHVPLDVHVGSIAIKKMIESKQPFLTLHGHIHESSRITKEWKQKIGDTWCFNAALEPPELSIIQFDMENPENAKRIIL